MDKVDRPSKTVVGRWRRRMGSAMWMCKHTSQAEGHGWMEEMVWKAYLRMLEEVKVCRMEGERRDVCMCQRG